MGFFEGLVETIAKKAKKYCGETWPLKCVTLGRIDIKVTEYLPLETGHT